jgi:hypothetical protein
MAWITEEEKRQRESNANWGAFGGGIFKLIFLFIPMILGKIFGFLIGIFLKLGIFGRVVLTMLFTAGVFIILAIIGMVTGLIPQESDLTVFQNIASVIKAVICLAIAIFLGIFWFWRRHYKILKNIPLGIFSNLVMICFAICLYGTIAFQAVFMYLVFKVKGGTAFAMGMGISLLIAIIFWLIKTRAYGSPDYVPEEYNESAAEDGNDIDALTVAAGAGDIQAKVHLANAFLDGDGVKQDKQKGFTLMKEAAESGNPVAQYNMAIFYYDGDFAKQDETKAFDWYKKAAENGHAEAQYCMGLAYTEGLGGYPQDMKKARGWFEKSAVQGNKDAKKALKNL